ncbi:hypothetical protein ACTJJ8_05630 [Agrobacterium radiobacter]|jgi:hypothetical protein|uniref:Uncharacterized protein n=1 Tax=Agrobacterium tumefaciens TaxID=358 RepID=A0AAP9E243_AGRTU|nr:MULTISPECIES: hypothetical protein [Agrobacterium]AYM80770.1 dehydrogenase [Agrobacterium tumefaciens]MQB36861.1 hypothetical protein [Agrobacterium tumefaciens]NSZ57300.1 hypothetical protein [Agrobacterium tumefaciens]NTA47578.1 hypothetical protein [Agrobacterium tumefaciens]NTE91461.1 hypothetical protein [Agrobacterium tumefaciens]
MPDAEKITPARPDDIAGYVIQCHDGDAKAAVEALLGEIEHLQEQLSLAVAIMGNGYTRGWKPDARRD